MLVKFVNENLKKEFLINYKPINCYDLFNINPSKMQNNPVDLNSKFFNQTNLIPNTYFTQPYLNTKNEGFLFILSMIKDKSFIEYNKFTKPYEKDLERAHYLIANNITQFDGYNATREQALGYLLKYMSNHIKEYLLYTNELPGFDKICIDDLILIHSQNITFFSTLRRIMLVINDELYLMIDDFQLSRSWLTELLGVKITDYLFQFYRHLNGLNLTSYEMAIIFPFMLTSIDDVSLKNPEVIHTINQYYSRALMYEFSLNRRDINFIDKISEVNYSFFSYINQWN